MVQARCSCGECGGPRAFVCDAERLKCQNPVGIHSQAVAASANAATCASCSARPECVTLHGGVMRRSRGLTKVRGEAARHEHNYFYEAEPQHQTCWS